MAEFTMGFPGFGPVDTEAKPEPEEHWFVADSSGGMNYRCTNCNLHFYGPDDAGQDDRDTPCPGKQEPMNTEGHFWIAKRGSTQLVCENCGLLCPEGSFESYNSRPCARLVESKPKGNLSDRKVFEDGILANPQDKLARVVYADYLQDNEDLEYAAAMRAAPDWLIRTVWDIETGFPLWQETQELWIERLTIHIITLDLRTKVVLWSSYLSSLFLNPESDRCPNAGQVAASFPTNSTNEFVDSMIETIRKRSPLETV